MRFGFITTTPTSNGSALSTGHIYRDRKTAESELRECRSVSEARGNSVSYSSDVMPEDEVINSSVDEVEEYLK